MNDNFTGAINATALMFAPRFYALCNGALMNIPQYSAMFSLLGTNYGGDGRATFGLPDLRGRAAVGSGNGIGLSSVILGQKLGAEATYITLGEGHLPRHSHSASTSQSKLVGSASASCDVQISGGLAVSKTNGVQKAAAGDYLANPTFDGEACKGFVGADQAGETVVVDGLSLTSTANVAVGPVTTNVPADLVSIGFSGNGAPFEVETRSPGQGVSYVICTEGIYPSRS